MLSADPPRLVSIRTVDLDAASDRRDAQRLLDAYIDTMEDDVCVGAHTEERVGLPEVYAAPGGLWLAMVDGRACGIVGLRDRGAGAVELRRLYVDANARGFGIGAGLVDTLLDHARAMGAREVVLDTRPFMETAAALYASRGFEVVRDPAEVGDACATDRTRRIAMRLRL